MNANILWVDDEIELLKPHLLFLQGKGYNVESCNNGYDAIDIITDTRYDLIILDEMMPGMTGLETLLAWSWLQGTLYVARYGRAENPYAAEDAEVAGICALVLLPLCVGALAWAAYEMVLWWKTRAAARRKR